MADSVKINLEIATQAAEIALKNLKKNTESANSAFSVFKGAFAAGFALDGIKSAYSAIAGAVTTIIDEAAKAEESVSQLNIALKQAGLYSPKTTADFQALADEIERTTIYAGDAAEATIGLLATLTTLDKAGLAKATMAATDLAATLRVDLGTASDMLTKAINGNFTAFNKLGIEIQKGSSDSERLANILKALQAQQGAAAQASLTFSGAIEKANNQKGKLLENVGKLITQNPLLIAGFNALADSLAAAAEWVEKNSDDILLMAKSMAYSIGIVSAAGLAWVTYTALTGGATVALGALRIAAATTWAAVTGPVGLVVAAIAAVGVAIYAVVKYWDNIKIAIYDTTAVMLEYAAKAAAIFNSNGAAVIKAEADAFRDKANAIKTAQQAQIDAENSKANGDEVAAQAANAKNLAAKLKEDQKEQVRLNAEKLADRQAFNAQVMLQDTDFNLAQIEAKSAHEQAMFDISGAFDLQVIQNQLATEQAQLTARQQFESDSLNASIDAQRKKDLLIEDALVREKTLRDNSYKADLETQKLRDKQSLDQIKAKNKAEETIDKARVSSRRDTLSTIATLSNSSNKELAIIGKAAGVAQIAIDTPVAISKALASAPPPFNFALAGLVGVAMAAQAAQIAGLNFAKGGIVPGTSFTGDRVAANVNSREMILTTQQQAQLFKIANGNSNSNGNTDGLLVELIDAVKSRTSISIDGKEIIAVVRNGLQSGRTV